MQTKEGGRKDMYIIITFIHLKDTWKVIPEADPLGKKLIALLNEQKGLSNHDDTSVSLNIGVSGTRMTNVGTTTIYHPNIDDRKTYNQKGAEADQKLLLLSQLE